MATKKKDPVQGGITQVNQLIDDLGSPGKMTLEQWVDFLRNIEMDCEMKREAAEEEMKEAKERR